MSDDPLLDAYITDFADHLVPEAFTRGTSATRVFLESPAVAAADLDGFDRWVEARLDEVLAVAWPEGHPRAVTLLSDGRLRWRFEECGCGYLACAVHAAAEEACALETPWVFAAWLPRPLPRWEVRRDAFGDELDEVLVPPDDPFWLATWYAEARGRGVAANRAGVVSLRDEVVTSRHEVPPRGTSAGKAFHRVLYRHPARRRHPLRRRR